MPLHFKIDENLPIEAAEPLRRAGHLVVTVLDQQRVAEPDWQIAQDCQEVDQILVTLDPAFAEIGSSCPGVHNGIVILLPRSQDRASVVALVERLVQWCDRQIVRQRLWVLQEDGLRIVEPSPEPRA